MARAQGVALQPALAQLQAIYDDVDQRNASNTKDLDLPCHRGCDMCCHESVFLTPLEFYGVWQYVQTSYDEATRSAMVAEGLRIYAEQKHLIDALEQPPPDGARDHFEIAKQIRFTCPFLGTNGECRVYPARELLARLFGCSFNDDLGVYGCHLVAKHLAGKQVTLLPARGTARRLNSLPLTEKRQVFPYYLNVLYGS